MIGHVVTSADAGTIAEWSAQHDREPSSSASPGTTNQERDNANADYDGASHEEDHDREVAAIRRAACIPDRGGPG